MSGNTFILCVNREVYITCHFIYSTSLSPCLNNGFIQIAYLDDWAVLERDHIAALSGAVEDLEANTLRLPVAGRARVKYKLTRF